MTDCTCPSCVGRYRCSTLAEARVEVERLERLVWSKSRVLLSAAEENSRLESENATLSARLRALEAVAEAVNARNKSIDNCGACGVRGGWENDPRRWVVRHSPDCPIAALDADGGGEGSEP